MKNNKKRMIGAYIQNIQIGEGSEVSFRVFQIFFISFIFNINLRHGFIKVLESFKILEFSFFFLEALKFYEHQSLNKK